MRSGFGGTVAVVAAVAAVVAACGGGGEPTPLGQGNPDKGRDLYQRNCASCHGADLRGTTTGPPLLDPMYAPDVFPDDRFRLAVRRGMPQTNWTFGPMAPIPAVSDDDVAHIVAYVRQLQRSAGLAPSSGVTDATPAPSE